MQRVFRSRWLALAVAAAVSSAAPAKALRVAGPIDVPATQQAITADTVVVGKVIEIEKEPTKAKLAPNSPLEVEYRVAVVKIEEGILGVNGVTTVRVGFQGPVGADAPVPQPIQGRPIARPAIARISTPGLTDGQEGCFFLTKHPTADFFVMQQFAQPLDKKSPNFKKELDSVKKMLAVFEDPKAALQKGDAAERGFAAVMLVQKYRRYPVVNVPNAKVVQQPIDAEESKLILTALSQLDWGKVDPNGASLQQAFYQLGLKPQDGWTQPKFQQGQDFNKVMGDAVSKWLKENADKYRVSRQVVAK